MGGERASGRACTGGADSSSLFLQWKIVHAARTDGRTDGRTGAGGRTRTTDQRERMRRQANRRVPVVPDYSAAAVDDDNDDGDDDDDAIPTPSFPVQSGLAWAPPTRYTR